MHSTSDRLKIVYRKSVRVIKSVPSNDIERMRGVDVVIKVMLFFDLDEKVTLFIMRLQVGRNNQISLAIRRMFQQLSEFIPISLRGVDWTKRLYIKQAVISIVKMNLIN